MEKDCYQEIIAEVSKKLSQKFISEEKDLAKRATLIDKDIAEIVQDIGLQTTKKVGSSLFQVGKSKFSLPPMR